MTLKNTLSSLAEDIKKNDTDTYNKFLNVYSKYRRNFSALTMKDTKSGTYYFIIKVPSSSFKRGSLDYDVVLEVKAPTGTNIFDGSLRFFSNSPSFTYTYTYVYNQHNLLIPWLKQKYTKQLLTVKPSSRNPKELLELDQSLKIAILYIDQNYNTRDLIVGERKVARTFRNNIDKKAVYNVISSAVKKVEVNKEVKVVEQRKEKQKQRFKDLASKPMQILKSSDKKTSTTKKSTPTKKQASKPASRKAVSGGSKSGTRKGTR